MHSVFVWHPVLMSVAVLLVLTNGIFVHYEPRDVAQTVSVGGHTAKMVELDTSARARRARQRLHTFLQTLGVLGMVRAQRRRARSGLHVGSHWCCLWLQAAAVTFVLVSKHKHRRAITPSSVHGYLGLSTLVLALLQMALGVGQFMARSNDSGALPRADRFETKPTVFTLRRVHGLLGRLLHTLALIQVMLGWVHAAALRLVALRPCCGTPPFLPRRTLQPLGTHLALCARLHAARG